MPSYDIIIVFAVILLLLASLYSEIIKPVISFFIAIVLLNISGILTPIEVLSGLANEQLAVVVFLLILGKTIQKRPLVEAFFSRWMNKISTQRGFMSMMVPFIAGISSFINNTPIVAMLLPTVNDWAKRNHIAPSKVLIPLAYAATLGGGVTLIGTSTNMIVNSLVESQAINPAVQPLGMFDFIYVGIPMVFLGYLYLLFFSDKLLPAKTDVVTDFQKKTREYLVETHIAGDSPLIGKTVEEANLRHLRGLFLVEIIRDKQVIAPVSPDRYLQEGDNLIFAGNVDTIADLVKPLSRLPKPKIVQKYAHEKIDIMEVVISYNSSLIGKKVRDSNFRGKYNAAIFAIHRNGEKLSGKIGDVVLKAGDVLLLVAGSGFAQMEGNVHDFYFISKVKEILKYNIKKTSLLVGGTLLAITLSIAGIASLFQTLLVLFAVLLISRVMTITDIRTSIDYDLVTLIALGLALGTAMMKTGAADLMAHSLIRVFEPLGTVGIMFGLVIIASILTAFMSNASAAVIVFPIALSIALSMGLNPTPFFLLVAYGAGMDFATPVGYQTNLMVYGPGGYSFMDFLRIGLPLTVIYMVVSVLVLAYVYNLF